MGRRPATLWSLEPAGQFGLDVASKPKLSPRLGESKQSRLNSVRCPPSHLELAASAVGSGTSVFLIEIRELLLKLSQLRQIVENDIRMIGMTLEEILVVLLGRIESLERDDLGHYRS